MIRSAAWNQRRMTFTDTRPVEEWPRTPEGELAMFTKPLDLDGLLAAAD